MSGNGANDLRFLSWTSRASLRTEYAIDLRDLRAGIFIDALIFDSFNLNNGLRDAMSRRRIGQKQFGFAVDRGRHSSLDSLSRLVDRKAKAIQVKTGTLVDATIIA